MCSVRHVHQRRAQQAVQQQIAGELFRPRAVQDQRAGKARLRCRGGRQTAVIRLHAAHGHQRVRPPGQRVSQQKFRLRVLLPPSPSGVRSSRLMYSGPQPSACSRFSMR